MHSLFIAFFRTFSGIPQWSHRKKLIVGGLSAAMLALVLLLCLADAMRSR
jgi:hypothetical protein